MPITQFGIVGKRLVWTWVAILATVLAIVIAGPFSSLVWVGLIGGTFFAFLSSYLRLQHKRNYELSPIEAYDAWIGAACATLAGAVVAVPGNLFLGHVTIVVLTYFWKVEWVYPSMDKEQVKALVERSVREVWRRRPGHLLIVRRERYDATFPVVSFQTESDTSTTTETQRRAVSGAFARPFVLTVLFGPDAFGPYEMTEFVSPRLAELVDVGSLRELDTYTPIWTAPTTAHARMAFEASLLPQPA